MQKFIFLKYQSGLITDGFWKQCRHPNYFGELLIYLSFVIMVIETPLWWLPTCDFDHLFIIAVWIPNMIKIDKSLSRFEEHESYKEENSFYHTLYFIMKSKTSNILRRSLFCLFISAIRCLNQNGQK